jgi:hypothetical protein
MLRSIFERSEGWCEFYLSHDLMIDLIMMHKRKPKNLRMRSQGQGSIVEKLKGPVLNVEHAKGERIQQVVGMNQYKL